MMTQDGSGGGGHVVMRRRSGGVVDIPIMQALGQATWLSSSVEAMGLQHLMLHCNCNTKDKLPTNNYNIQSTCNYRTIHLRYSKQAPAFFATSHGENGKTVSFFGSKILM